VLTAAEHRKIGIEGWGLLTTLASNGSLSRDRMELVIDRAMATPGYTLELDQLKLVALLVFWSLHQPSEALMNEGLLDNSAAHAVH
jgi:Smg protein